MATEFSILQQGVDDIGEAARQARLRFSKADGETLIAEYQKAAKEQHCLQLLAEDLARKTWWYSCGTRQMKATWQETSEQMYLQVVRILGVVAAIRDVIAERLSKNGVNRNFGLLKIAHDLDNPAGVENAFKELRRIARSIPSKQGTFWRHPDKRGGFDSTTNLVLARELADIRDVAPMTALAQTLDNKFAFIYKALQNAFCDDIRRACRRPEGQPSVDADNVEALNRTPESDIERRETAKIIEAAKAESKYPGIIALLDEVKERLADRDSLIDMNVRQIGAALVRNVAQRLGVTVRQARNYRDAVRSDVTSKNLQALRDVLRD